MALIGRTLLWLLRLLYIYILLLYVIIIIVIIIIFITTTTIIIIIIIIIIIQWTMQDIDFDQESEWLSDKAARESAQHAWWTSSFAIA